MTEIKVIIFEDLELIRNSLKLLINQAAGMICVGAFGEFTDLIQKIEKLKPDVVLMDIGMPGMTGINAVKEIKDMFPEIQILMQTVYQDDDNILESIVAGASGYLLKNSLPEKLIDSIHEAYHGGVPFSPEIARKVLQLISIQNSDVSKVNLSLSNREIQVLNGLVKGYSYKKIAEDCFLGIDAIKFHLKNIYAKLHVHSKTEAVLKAIQHKII